ncbi:MAG: 30S ribosomal protein S11 [Candidatus Gracilibacteria bacterium]|jgi:small subunit ribosomal protein S11
MADEKTIDTKSEKAESAKASEGKAETKKTGKPEVKAVKSTKGKKKAKRRLLQEGKAYIQASYNNTIVTITDMNGEVIAWSSAGSNGFKGAKKATPYAAQVSAENAITKAKVYGLERIHVFIKGVGTGREQSIRGLQAGGVNIESITDLTPVTHNGCRPRKSRRV